MDFFSSSYFLLNLLGMWNRRHTHTHASFSTSTDISKSTPSFSFLLLHKSLSPPHSNSSKVVSPLHVHVRYFLLNKRRKITTYNYFCLFIPLLCPSFATPPPPPALACCLFPQQSLLTVASQRLIKKKEQFCPFAAVRKHRSHGDCDYRLGQGW